MADRGMERKREIGTVTENTTTTTAPSGNRHKHRIATTLGH